MCIWDGDLEAGYTLGAFASETGENSDMRHSLKLPLHAMHV